MATTMPTARDRQVRDFTNLGLWTFQGWLAMFFFAAGYAKLTEPLDNLVTLMRWPALVSENLVRGVGIVEIVLALGILAPLVSWRVGRPILMLSAIGLLAIQATMLVIHWVGVDIGLAVTNAILLALTVSVLLGRRGRS